MTTLDVSPSVTPVGVRPSRSKCRSRLARRQGPGCRAYRGPGEGGRQAPLVSLAEIGIAGSRTVGPPFSVSLRRQLLEFIDRIDRVITPELADQLHARVESPVRSARRMEDSSRVLREFVIAAMGTSSMQQEFTHAGVQMLAELPPEIVVAPDTPSRCAGTRATVRWPTRAWPSTARPWAS